MKGIVIFDKSNDVAFLHSDCQFRVYLNQLGVSRGLLQHTEDEQPLDRDMVMQLLSPFMTSQRFLNAYLKTAYQSIRSEDGQLFVFMQFGESIYVAINGDSTESENFLTRKLAILNRIIRFTLGPMLSELKPDNLVKRLERWNFIGQLLTTWCQLYSTEESFLLEAVERLHVNPDLNCKFVGFLESAFTLMKSKRQEAIHSMLLVNNKLLSLFSDTLAPTVDVSDVMMVIIQIRSLFPGHSSEENRAHLLSRSSSSGSSSMKRVDEAANVAKILQENSLPCMALSDDKIQAAKSKNRHSSDSSSAMSETASAHSVEKNVDDIRTVRHSREELFWTPEEKLPDVEKRIVFLRRGPVALVPHVLHCIPITVDISLVFICEITHVEDSTALAKLLETIGRFLSIRWSESIGSAAAAVKTLDSLIKTIQPISHRYGNLESVSNPIQTIGEKWKEINSSTFIQHLEEAERKRELDQRLQYDLQQMYSQVLGVLHRLFFVPRASTTEEENDMTSHLIVIQSRMRASLHDFAKFLIVKSLNNFTLTSYFEKLPGLVHFLYVDRTGNQLTTTSLAIGNDRNSNKAEVMTIKAQLWKLIDQMRDNLLQGYTSTTVQKGNYYYNYSLWFEDTQGKALAIRSSLVSTSQSTCVLPGIIAHNFYRKLATRCFPKEEQPVGCYELITVHTSNMPKSLVLEQCQKLVGLLIQSSVVSNSPLPLF